MDAHDRIRIELRERLKELRCLNEATALLSETGRNAESVLSALILGIGEAFQFPERAKTELLLGEKRYITPDYRETENSLREPVTLNGNGMGTLTVCYSGPEKTGFLPEERDLLHNLAQMIACYQSKRESELKLHETIEQLEHRSAKLEALLDALPDLLFILATDGTIMDFHAGKPEDLAMPPEDFLNRNISGFFPATLSERFLAMIGRAIAGEKSVFTEYSMQIGGTTRHYETRMSRYGDSLVIALVNNITERVLARERLIQSEERYRSLIDSSDAMIAMVDREGRILYMNPIAASFYRMSPSDLSGKSVQDMFPPDQARTFLDATAAIIETGAGRVLEQTMDFGEGRKCFRTSVQPVRGTEGKAFAVMINASDITALKNAEEKTRRSERNYRSLFTNAPYGYLIHRNGLIIECNETAARMVNGTRSQLIGHTILEFAPEFQPNGRRSAEAAPELIATALAKGSLRFEWMHVRFDGSQFLTEVNLGIVEYDDEPLIFATWRDITQERKAEEELRTFRTISDQSNIGTAIADLDGSLVYVNGELARMHGRTTDELAGKHLSLLHSESQMVDVRKALDLIRKEGEIKALEIWHIRSDGSVFPTLMNVKLIRDNNGAPQCMVSTAMDISDLKRKEAEIRKLNLAIEQSPVALVVTDLDGVIIHVSPAFTRITGYESEEVIGKKTNILKSGQTPLATYKDLWATITRGGIWKGEWINRKKNGDYYTESVTISPVSDERGKIINYLAVKEDVTLNRQAEKERIARTVAEEASKSKTVFLSNMSHEIRTPLNAIIGFAHILERDEALGAIEREQAATISRSGDHLLKLVNDILDFSRIESGKTALEPSDFNLRSLLEDIRSMFGPAASQKGLQLLCEWRDTMPLYVNADEKKIRQILINILGNAIKFTKVGGVAFRVKGAGSLDRPVLEAEIEDSGPGIPPEDLDHIFDSFQQSQAGRETGGTGLGLAISRQLVNMMGGSIDVKSVLGKGSIFRLEIPVMPARDAKALTTQGSRKELLRLAPGTPPVRILVADDIEDNRWLLRTVLESAGFEVRETADGIETLQAVREWKPHAVLLDLRMPRMDGFETARTLISDPSTASIPVIAVTASAFEEDKITVAETGFSGYVRKPFQNQEILELLRSTLHLDFELTQAVPAGRTGAIAVSARDMMALTSATKSEFLTALERGDMTRFKALLKRIASTSPELAAAMADMANRYDYDRLHELLIGR